MTSLVSGSYYYSGCDKVRKAELLMISMNTELAFGRESMVRET